MSFFEYCQLLNIDVPHLLEDIKSTQIISNRYKSKQKYLINFLVCKCILSDTCKCGFPELALSSDDLYAQRVLREDIVDKVLKRDLPSIYGIRNISDTEKIFLYLCYTSSNVINLNALTKELEGVSRNTIEKYIGYLESANLIYISPLVNISGKQVFKSKDKIYIADAAIMRNAVLMKDDITNDPTELGIIAETAVYKHIKAFYFKDTATVGYFRGDKKDKEIDMVVKSERFRPIMIEVKYRDKQRFRKKMKL